MKDFEYLTSEDHEELWDINLAGACVTRGQEIEAYNRDPKNYPRVGFVFRKSKELERIIKEYLNEKLLVNPKEFSENIRKLKSRTKIPY
jgi:hypothetical protein